MRIPRVGPFVLLALTTLILAPISTPAWAGTDEPLSTTPPPNPQEGDTWAPPSQAMTMLSNPWGCKPNAGDPHYSQTQVGKIAFTAHSFCDWNAPEVHSYANFYKEVSYWPDTHLGSNTKVEYNTRNVRASVKADCAGAAWYYGKASGGVRGSDGTWYGYVVDESLWVYMCDL